MSTLHGTSVSRTLNSILSFFLSLALRKPCACDTWQVWTAPSKQINQRATATDFAVYETLPIGANSNFFEMYALDVGHITSVRLTRPAGDDFGATYVRIRKPDNAGADAQTFRCSVTSLHHEVQDTDDQYCVVASDTTIVDPATAPVGSVAHDSCSCFREFKVVEDRVITCTSDGCYSSSADGQNGWSGEPVSPAQPSIMNCTHGWSFWGSVYIRWTFGVTIAVPFLSSRLALSARAYTRAAPHAHHAHHAHHVHHACR